MKHNAVVAALAAKTGGYPEVYVLGGAASGRVDTYGRIDVATRVDANYCVADGAIIYEVKPASSYGFRTGRKQLVRYQKAAAKNGIMVEIADTDPALGIVAAPDGSLLYTTFSGGVIYYCDISYDPQPILASEPKAVTEEDYAPVPVKDVVAGVVTATALIVIAYFTGGLGAIAVA